MNLHHDERRSNKRRAGLKTLFAVIAQSQIVIAAPASGRPAVSLPPGFDEADIVILEWIAAHGRRLGRNLMVM